jgi:hypothetical protein
VRTRALQESLRTGREEDGKPLTAERRKEVERDLKGRDAVAAEFAAVKDRTPDTALTRDLEIDLGGLLVQVNTWAGATPPGSSWCTCRRRRSSWPGTC